MEFEKIKKVVGKDFDEFETNIEKILDSISDLDHNTFIRLTDKMVFIIDSKSHGIMVSLIKAPPEHIKLKYREADNIDLSISEDILQNVETTLTKIGTKFSRTIGNLEIGMFVIEDCIGRDSLKTLIPEGVKPDMFISKNSRVTYIPPKDLINKYIKKEEVTNNSTIININRESDIGEFLDDLLIETNQKTHLAFDKKQRLLFEKLLEEFNTDYNEMKFKDLSSFLSMLNIKSDFNLVDIIKRKQNAECFQSIFQQMDEMKKQINTISNTDQVKETTLVLPPKYSKIKNTSKSIRINKELFKDYQKALKKEPHLKTLKIVDLFNLSLLWAMEKFEN